jgi:mono/diheme cytochrome c family protein
MSFTKGAAPAAAAALALLLGCKFEPDTPELRYSLNAKILADPSFESYAGDRVAQDKLRGALELLVGTPSNPGFFRTEGMLDDEFDPNYQGGDLSEQQWADIQADNARRFAADLQHIAAGDFDAVRLPREALDLRADWGRTLETLDGIERDLARAEAGQPGEDGKALDAGKLRTDAAAERERIQAEWPTYLKEYYPSLRDSAEMYRTQCMHCHGVEGGGNGTTAPYLSPLPRDYRKGIFKFTSVGDKAKPTRADLHRVLAEGIYTSAMPSFRRFSEAQLHGLVDYVRLLSIRGRVEELVALDYDPEEGGIKQESVFEAYDGEWQEWLAAPEHVIKYDGEVPKPTPELIARGKELFFDANTANCASCHGTDLRGNGPSTKKQDPETGAMVQITDDWGNDIYPRDLKRNVYRFGRRSIDLYRRFYAGINGTPMPAQSTLTDAQGKRLLPDEDLWALVHYVRSEASQPMVEHRAAAQEHGQEQEKEGGH